MIQSSGPRVRDRGMDSGRNRRFCPRTGSMSVMAMFRQRSVRDHSVCGYNDHCSMRRRLASLTGLPYRIGDTDAERVQFEFRCAMIPRMVSLGVIVPLLLAATALNAQQNEKQGAVSLTIEPARITLTAGQTQRFSAHIKGAPTGTVIIWAVPDSERDVSSVSQDGLFAARIVGIYHVVAIATIDGTALKHAVAKVTVVAQYDGPIVR
jgi:hypothetical protein